MTAPARHEFGGPTGWNPRPRRQRRGRPLLAVGLVLLGLGVRVGLNVWRDRTPMISPPAGFSSRTAQPPATGTWAATGTTLKSVGISNEPPGSILQREWTITRACSGTCPYILTRNLDTPTGAVTFLRVVLIHEPDGWAAVWPTQRYICGGTNANPIYWTQQEDWIPPFP